MTHKHILKGKMALEKVSEYHRKLIMETSELKHINPSRWYIVWCKTCKTYIIPADPIQVPLKELVRVHPKHEGHKLEFDL